MSSLNQCFVAPFSTSCNAKMIKNKVQSKGGVNTEQSELLDR